MSRLDLLFLTPLVPLVARLAFVVRFWTKMGDVPSEDEQDRDGHRSPILAFAGFAFTGVVALIVLEPTIQQTLYHAVFLLLSSFLAYLWAFNLHGYKGPRWQGELASTLGDVGSLCLVASFVALLATSRFSGEFIVVSSLVGFGVWTIDYVIRYVLDARYLIDLEAAEREERIGGETN